MTSIRSGGVVRPAFFCDGPSLAGQHDTHEQEEAAEHHAQGDRDDGDLGGLVVVAEVAVVGVADGDLGQRIEAVIVPVEGMSVSADEVIAHVAAQLSIHKRPRNVHIVESLPRNALGKVQKAQIRASLEESA